METTLRIQAVTIILKVIRPLVEIDLINVPESQLIAVNLRHLAEKGTLQPAILPKLVTQEEAAEILCLGWSNFKRIEKEGRFPFRRKMIGTAVRYRNTDLYAFIASSTDIASEVNMTSEIPAQPASNTARN